MTGKGVSLCIALDSFIIENRFFSNMIYPNHSFLSLYSFQPTPTFLLPQVYFSSIFSSEESRPPRDNSQTGHKASLHIDDGQDNTTGGNEF